MRRGEANQRTDVSFHIPNDDLKVPVKYPLNTLGKLSVKIIQPTEFIREYAEESDEAIPFLRAANVEDGHLNLDDIVFVDSRKFINAKDSFVDTGDILITRTGAKAGATCVVPELYRKYCVSSHSIRVIPRKDMVLPDFLEAFLLSKWGKSQITRLFTGAAQKQLQLTTVAKIQIPVPAIEVQQKLVSDLEAAREARKRRLAEADALLAGIDGFLLEKLGLAALEEDNRQVFAVRLSEVRDAERFDPQFHQPHYTKIMKGLSDSVKLGTLITDIHYGASVPNTYAEKGIPFLRIKNLSPCEINTTDIVSLPNEMRKELGKAFVSAGDFLISRSGSIGIVALVPQECEGFAFGSFMIRFAVADSVNKDYLEVWLNSSIARALIERNRIGAIQGNITIETIRNIPIVLPPSPIQQSIASEITRRREEARRLRAEAAKGWEEAKGRFERELLG